MNCEICNTVVAGNILDLQEHRAVEHHVQGHTVGSRSEVYFIELKTLDQIVGEDKSRQKPASASTSTGSGKK